MKDTCVFRLVVVAVTACLLALGCERSPSSPPPRSHASGPVQKALTVPPELQATVEKLVRAAEAFDIPLVLDTYADDFRSGTGRSKDGVRDVFMQLQNNHVNLKVERADVEAVESTKAKLKTRLRLRYTDRFRDLGEGEVVVTDTLVHSLRKEEGGWKIYADERVSTYREGRFGSQSPNVQVEVPDTLPSNLDYPIKVSVQRETDTLYEVMIGNYPEDPEFLPPPDIVSQLPDSGVMTANLLPNPQGRSEMVRITVIAQDTEGNWVGATTVSKFVHGARREKPAEPRGRPEAPQV